MFVLYIDMRSQLFNLHKYLKADNRCLLGGRNFVIFFSLKTSHRIRSPLKLSLLGTKNFHTSLDRGSWCGKPKFVTTFVKCLFLAGMQMLLPLQVHSEAGGQGLISSSLFPTVLLEMGFLIHPQACYLP